MYGLYSSFWILKVPKATALPYTFWQLIIWESYLSLCSSSILPCIFPSPFLPQNVTMRLLAPGIRTTLSMLSSINILVVNQLWHFSWQLLILEFWELERSLEIIPLEPGEKMTDFPKNIYLMCQSPDYNVFSRCQSHALSTPGLQCPSRLFGLSSQIVGKYRMWMT